MSVLNPWAAYQLLGGGAGSPFAGSSPGTFGSLSGQTITAPVQPPPAPPNSSALTGLPSALATAVSPMPVSSGVAPAPAPAPSPSPAPPTPSYGAGNVYPGWQRGAQPGQWVWAGSGTPGADPMGNPMPPGVGSGAQNFWGYNTQWGAGSGGAPMPGSGQGGQGGPIAPGSGGAPSGGGAFSGGGTNSGAPGPGVGSGVGGYGGSI